jgi:hypothetical protein
VGFALFHTVVGVAGGPAAFTILGSACLAAALVLGAILALTVRVTGREVSRRVNVSPLLRLEPGAEIAVVYDRGDPANFQPAPGSPAGWPARAG